jgi:hypothetical protein
MKNNILQVDPQDAFLIKKEWITFP